MGRETYIDSMRGLAMLLVVIFHVTYECFHSENIIIRVVNIQLQLPFFFFISGFFASKLNRNGVLQGIIQQVKRLLIPSLLMLALYCWVMNLDYLHSLNLRLKEGYWFTIVLFEFGVIYILTDAVCNRMTILARLKPYIHLLVGCAIVYLSSFSEKWNATYPIINTFSIGEFYHYIFFVLGSVLYSRREEFYKFLDNTPWSMAAILIIYLFLDVARYKYGFASLRLLAMMTVSLLISTGLVIIWRIFKNNKFVGGNLLAFIGQRSIDVYFLHYFLLPRDMSFVGEFFARHHIPFVEYCIAVLLALLLVAASLLMGQILRLSPFMGQWLLGQKR